MYRTFSLFYYRSVEESADDFKQLIYVMEPRIKILGYFILKEKKKYF